MILKRLQRNKYLFENGLTITLNSDIVNQYNLKKREELTHEEYLEVLELAALSLSYYYLTKRDHSKREIYLKLKDKYREEKVINKVILKLENLGYLDDYQFAKNYIEGRKESRKKLEYKLWEKGISSDIIKEVFEEYSDELELEKLEKEIKKIAKKDKEKQIATLLRKGFKYDDIKKVLK